MAGSSPPARAVSEEVAQDQPNRPEVGDVAIPLLEVLRELVLHPAEDGRPLGPPHTPPPPPPPRVGVAGPPRGGARGARRPGGGGGGGGWRGSGRRGLPSSAGWR